MDQPLSNQNLEEVPVIQQIEHVVVETLPLEKKLEILKKFNYIDTYEVGKFVDAMDTVNAWCLAEIVGCEQRNLNIHFDGWSSKWDCFYKVQAQKVAPFRKFSRGYTGQQKVALRGKLHFTLEELHKEKIIVEGLIESDLNGLGALETTQYLRGRLYVYVDSLMGIFTYNDEQIDAVNDFLYAVIRLIVTYLKKFPKLIPLFSQVKVNSDLFLIDENIAILMSHYELFDILKKLFCCCHRSLKYYLLFDKNVIPYDKPVAHCEDNQVFEKQRRKDEDEIDVDEVKEWISQRKNLVFGQFINFVNYFAEIGGFDALMDILKAGNDSDENKVPLDLVSLITAPFKNCNLIFSATFTEHFVTSVKEIVFQRIRNMSEKEIKEIDKEVVSKVLSDIKDFLNLHYSDAQTSELVESNQLYMAHRFLKSTYLEKRLKGLNHIKNMIDRIEAGQKSSKMLNSGGAYQRMMDQDQDMNGGNVMRLKPPKWLTAEYLKDWILQQRVLETVFGENTHLEIVKRSGCFLKFLAKQGSLPSETIDLIWKCQLGKHEEMVRVIYNVIKDLVPHISQDQINLFYLKIQTVPHKQFDEKFLTFLKDFTMKALDNYYDSRREEMSTSEEQAVDFDQFCDNKETAISHNLVGSINDPNKGLIGTEKLYGLPIFWDLIQDKMSSVVSNEMMDLAITSMTEILKAPFSKHIRMSYVIRCVENLIKGESIVQSIIISQAIISEYPEFNYNQTTVTHLDLIQRLEAQCQIVEVLIANIGKYHSIVKEKLKVMTDKKNKSPSTGAQAAQDDYTTHVFLGRHNHAFTINKLLEYLEFLIIGSGNKVQFGINNIESMWKLFVQQPNFMQDQNIYLKWINKQREVTYNKQELFLFSDEEKKFFFTSILCNKTYIDYRTISIGQVKSFHKYFILINRQEDVIALQRNGKTLRVVDFARLKLNGLDTLWNITIESENDKVKEESMDLLVDLYLKFDQVVSVEVQKQIWEEFVEKCMQIIEQGGQGQDQSVQSALQCLSKFIDRYDGKKPIKPELKISSQFSNIQPLTIIVFNKTDQTRKQVNATYFQSLGYLRQKIAEAFDCQINEFQMSIRNNYIDPDVDDDNYIKDIGQIQQVLIQKNASYLPENHPKNLISNNQAYFDKLFSILSSQQSSLIEPTWDLLMKLPVNARLSQELKELTLVQKDPSNWSVLLDPRSTLKLLYTLKILLQLHGNKKDQKTQLWRNNFIKLGGFHHLLNTFLQLEVTKIETSLTLKCIDHLSNLLFELFLIDKSVVADVLKNKETFVHKCINLLDLISDFSIRQELERGEAFEDIQKRFQQSKMKKNKYKSYMSGNKGGDKKQQSSSSQNNQSAGNNNDDDEDNENQDSLCLQALYKQFHEEQQLVATIFKFLYVFVFNNDAHAVVYVPQYKNIEEMLLKSMLRSENFLLRQEMAKKVKELISSKTGSPEMKDLQRVIEILLLNIEPQAASVESRSTQIYDGLSSLIESLSPTDLVPLQAPVQNLIYTLAQEILKREIKEKNTQDCDYLLMGKMKLEKSLLQKFPHLKAPIGKILTDYLLHNCLFEIPNGGGASKQQSIGQGGAPKCKSTSLRKDCVKLLGVLCRDCVPNLNLVLKYLNTFNDCPSWRTNKEHDWNISLRESEKSSTGYVGIKNLGCICYMNSLFQQLFMLPTLRNDILSVKNNNPNNEEKEENMLYQLQLLFTGLLKSEKQYVNPKGFCHAFKDWEGNPTNVLEQMDVEEFFNMFMDRLETAIKGNPQDKTVQYHFGGKYTHEMICKGCPHTYERQEPFLALAVQVKNKKSILEGLDTFILGDMLEGENAYLCEKCDKKVDTLKRTSIKKLPRYLIIALKRFEFDFDRMIRVKVNDYCEFPMELNMEPYTQEGLARKEKAQKNKENKEGEDQTKEEEATAAQEEPLLPADYYMYNLSGIVVHTGTADSGHYYSFIKDKDRAESGKWYEMNDSIVRDFDPNDIPSECFGGEDTFQGYNMQQMKSMKWRNAYLLFYERKTQDDVVEDEEEEQKKAGKDQVMVSVNNELNEIENKIAYENQKYWQNRFLFGSEYTELVYDIALNWNTSCLIPKMFLTKNDDFHLLKVQPPPEYLHDSSIPDPADISLQLAKTMSPQELDAVEFTVFKFAVGFYIGILQRSANRNLLPATLSLIKAYVNKNVQNAKWFLEEFCNEQLIEENLLQNPQKEMRKFITGLLYCAMLKVYPEEKDRLNLYWKQPNHPQQFTVIGNLILILIKNMYELKKFVSHNLQYFQVLARFSSLGPEAREFLLRAKIIGRLMDYFYDEVSPYKDEFRNMQDITPLLKDKPDIGLPTQLDRKQMSYFQEIMERRRLKSMAEANPKYKYMIEIISNCIRASQIGALRSPYQLDDLNLAIQSSERDIFIPESKFLKRVFSFAQRTRSINYICQGYCHYTWNDQEHWIELIKVVIQGLNDHDYDDIRPYLMLAQYMVAKPSPCHPNPLDTILQNFVDVLKQNAQYFKFMETCLEFIFKITGRYEHVRQWFYAKKNVWEWIVEWIKEYKFPPNPMAQNSSIRLFKKRGNANYLQMQNQNFKNDQLRQTALYHYRIRRIQAMLEGTCSDTSAEVDLDLVDMQDHKYSIGDAADQYNRKNGSVSTSVVEQVLDEMIFARHQSDGNSYANWIACDTDKLIVRGAVQNSIKFKMVETLIGQLEAKRGANAGGNGDYGMHQSDEDEDHSDEEDSRAQ